MTQILVSPAEPSVLKVIGVVSGLCERYGCDFLWQDNHGNWCGIQRKEIHDLVASVQGDRLSKEMLQMVELNTRIIIIEGWPKWGADGKLMDKFTKWSRQAHHSLIQSLSSSGITVHQTIDITDTAFTIHGLVAWTNKTSHTSLMSRPKSAEKIWGEADQTDWQRWILQGLPGISVTLAKRIIETFGTIPVQWTITEQQLQTVKGIGAEKARTIYQSLRACAATDQPPNTSVTDSPDSASLSAKSTSTSTSPSKE